MMTVPRRSFSLAVFDQLTKLLGKEEPSSSLASLVPLQPRGSKPPFFWVHGDFSNAFLARYLDPDQPLYGFMHQSWDGKPAQYRTIPNMAAHYLSEIRTVQPHGPYFLGGYCFGGILSFEIAQQLRKEGQEVALLVLLNPPHFTATGHNRVSHSQPAGRGARRHLHALRLLGSEEKLPYILERVKGKVDGAVMKISTINKKMLQSVAWNVCLAFGCNLPIALRSPYILKVYRRAMRSYMPVIYPGRLIIFQASEDSRDPQGWSNLAAGGVDIRDVPSGHENVLKEPHLRVWAEQLKSCLQTAQAQIPQQTRWK
jgi:thioesterase domain-containing protein